MTFRTLTRDASVVRILLPAHATFVALSLAILSGAATALSQINPNSPTTQWVPILYGNNNFPDPAKDQQTGSPESDLVGNTTHASLYMKYNDGGFGSPTNGWLAFRLRVGADANPTGAFKGAAFIGVDGNRDGKLDLFIGVNNQGSGDQIGLWNPGTGLNTSPSTTSIVSPASKSYSETASVYNFTSVNNVIDPSATLFDLDGLGDNDQFLTFVVPFSDVVGALAAGGISGFTTNTAMQLVAATATQDNSLNQDLNGVSGGVNSSVTWGVLGAFTEPYSPSGTPVPEPSQAVLFGLAASVAVSSFIRRRARR